MYSKFKAGAVVVAILLVLFLLGTFLCLETINPGYAGLIYNRKGGLEGDTLGQGWHFMAPWKRVIEYPVSTETVYLTSDEHEGSDDDNSFTVPTSDGKQLVVGAEFNYHFDIEQLPTVFNKFRGRSTKDIEETFIRGKIKAWAGEITGRYSVMGIYGEERAAARKEAEDLLRERFGEWGIIVESFNFTEVLPDTQTMAAIQKVIDDKQALEQEKVKNEKALIEQDRKKVEAENKRIEAQGDADAALIRAEGEAKANEIILKSLSTDLIEYKKIEKWNGVNSQVVSGEGGGVIVNVKGE